MLKFKSKPKELNAICMKCKDKDALITVQSKLYKLCQKCFNLYAEERNRVLSKLIDKDKPDDDFSQIPKCLKCNKNYAIVFDKSEYCLKHIPKIKEE